MESTVFVTTDGVHIIHSQEMESKSVTGERWSSQHLLMRDGMHITDSQQIGSTAFANVRWSPPHLLLIDGVPLIYL